jgi:hypothetical protein
MSTLSITSNIDGTYTAGSIFRVRATANLDVTSRSAYIGDILITY